MAASDKVDARKLKPWIVRLTREDGDHCQGCGRAFQNLDVSIVGYDAARHLLIVGKCCVDRLLSAVAVSLYIAVNSNKPWSEDDRVWFAGHPERAHRLRRAYHTEWPGMAGMRYTVVRHQAPGRRHRLGVVACRRTAAGGRRSFGGESLGDLSTARLNVLKGMFEA